MTKETNKKFSIVRVGIAVFSIILLWLWVAFVVAVKSWYICIHHYGQSINNNQLFRASKPVIYLYPSKKQKVSVRLNFKWKIIASYPDYNNNIKWWEVEAYPDWKIIDIRDWKEYNYLFWEWIPSKKINWDLSRWFVVKWENIKEFLREKLKIMWLTSKEYNEFITYWYPKMMNNKYNYVHFSTEKYQNLARLKITPKPDSILRVFMVYKPLDKKIDIKPQKLEKIDRKWFTVIEWWGSEIK